MVGKNKQNQISHTIWITHLQLMKAAVPAKSYTLFIFLHRHLESPVMSTGSTQVGAAPSPSF